MKLCGVFGPALFSVVVNGLLAYTAPGIEEQSLLLEADDLTGAGPRLYEFANGERLSMSEEAFLAFKRKGIAAMDITDHQDDAFVSNVVNRPAVEYPVALAHQNLVNERLAQLSSENLQSTLKELSSFYTRYARSQNGLKSSIWVYDQVAHIADSREDINVTFFDHEWEQKSVIARIEGTENPDHVLIVSAHQDSINSYYPQLLPAPGADDDGSGTVTILEVFRVIVESGYRPKNTLEFHWYSAEELGLLGSQDIFVDYSRHGVDVKAMLHQDMTGYSAATLREGQDSIGIITDFVDARLTEFVQRVVDGYCEIPYVLTKCGYACSDHASATRYGYPAAVDSEAAFENHSPYIHTSDDTVSHLDFDHMLQHCRLVLGFAVELGETKF